jgi:hypothetical protein
MDPVTCLLAISSAVKLVKTAAKTVQDLESLGPVLGQFFSAKADGIKVLQQAKTKGFKGSSMGKAIELELALEQAREFEEQIKALFFPNKMDVWAKIVARAASIDKEAAHDARREREAAERRKKELDELTTLVLMVLVLGALLGFLGWLIFEVIKECGGRC